MLTLMRVDKLIGSPQVYATSLPSSKKPKRVTLKKTKERSLSSREKRYIVSDCLPPKNNKNVMQVTLNYSKFENNEPQVLIIVRIII